jgi:hypothetical protein
VKRLIVSVTFVALTGFCLSSQASEPFQGNRVCFPQALKSSPPGLNSRVVNPENSNQFKNNEFDSSANQFNSNANRFNSSKAGVVPDRIKELVGGKLQFFKNVTIPANFDGVYIVRGTPTEVVDFRTRGPYLLIKLSARGRTNGASFGSHTEWTIKSANQGILLVDDPNIEFIELRKDTFADSTFVWDFMLALDNTIQVRCPDGSIIEKQPLGSLALRR